MKSLPAVLLVALMSSPAAAQAPARAPVPQDFAWQWPIDTAGADGAVRLMLTPEIYARIASADLRDLAAFNANDELVPLGPAAAAFERLVVPPPPSPVAVPLFRVPRTDAGSGGDRIELHIARATDGRLTQLDASVAPGAGAATQDLLLDVSALDRPVTSLRLALEELGPEGLNARIEVAASDDLAQWQTVGSNLAVVSLQEGGLALERRQVEIAATQRPYLRLRRTDADAPLPVRAVEALPARMGSVATLDVLPAREDVSLPGTAVADIAGAFEYQAAGPFPIERITVELADRNSVAGFVLESRATPGAGWIERARGTAFRIGSNGDGVGSAPIELAPLRDRHWRLRSEPALARAPTLTLSYRPEAFVMLTQGAAPYRLAAGSRDARRPDYPLRTVLSQLRTEHGDLWLPPQASLGAGAPLAGDAALRAPPPTPPYRQWALWGVLIAGALGVIGMVLKLMKAPPA